MEGNPAAAGLPSLPLTPFQQREIRGEAGDGPHLLITAGIHGDEYEGIAALRRLIASVDPAKLCGRLTLIPIVNESAFARRSRCGEDERDLARTFPGRADGSPTERVAHALAALIRDADHYIDLHSGGAVMEVAPLCGYMLVSNPATLDTQRRMARAFGLPVVWGTSAELDGRSMSAARDAGVPAIYTEYLGGGRCSDDGVRACRDGCLNVMAALEMIDPRPAPLPSEITVEDPRPGSGHMQICHPSPAAGYFHPLATLGDTLAAGQTLGRVVDPLGDAPREIRADRSGRLIVLRSCPAVNEGDSLAVILETPMKP